MTIGVDASVAVALLVQTHDAHADVVRWSAGRDVALCGHALSETYSVLTRLPGDLRLAPLDAARLIDQRFEPALMLDLDAARNVHKTLGRLGIAGGAVYDGLIGFTALGHDVPLATRDARARGTYEALGARVVLAT